MSAFIHVLNMQCTSVSDDTVPDQDVVAREADEVGPRRGDRARRPSIRVTGSEWA